jgi:hypothetical protein
MMKYLVLLGVLIIPILSAAQSNYLPGYIVKNSGDSVKGFIHAKGLRSPPEYCKFKTDLKLEVNSFRPLEIRSFGTDSALLESLREFDRKTLKARSREFFRVLFDGKLDVLVGKGDRYFIRNDTGEFVYRLDKKDLLYYYTSDVPDLKEEIKSMKFSDSRIVELFSRYHNSLNIDSYRIYLPPRTLANLDFFLLAGYGISTLKTLNNPLEDILFNKSYMPLLGYGVDYFPSLRTRKSNFSLNVQNRFTKEVFQYQNEVDFNGGKTYTDILFEAFVIQIPVGLKFHKRVGNNLRGYIMPGLVYQRNIPVESRIITDNISGNEVTTSFDEIDYYSNTVVTWFTSVGVERKIYDKMKIFFDLYFAHSQDISYRRTTFSVTVGLKFINLKFDE